MTQEIMDKLDKIERKMDNYQKGQVEMKTTLYGAEQESDGGVMGKLRTIEKTLRGYGERIGRNEKALAIIIIIVFGGAGGGKAMGWW